jgi:hypothetical protein
MQGSQLSGLVEGAAYSLVDMARRQIADGEHPSDAEGLLAKMATNAKRILTAAVECEVAVKQPYAIAPPRALPVCEGGSPVATADEAVGACSWRERSVYLFFRPRIRHTAMRPENWELSCQQGCILERRSERGEGVCWAEDYVSHPKMWLLVCLLCPETKSGNFHRCDAVDHDESLRTHHHVRNKPTLYT